MKTALLAILLTSTSAMAHSFYEPSCCSNRDCAPIPAGDVKATPDGWQIVLTGEVIKYGSYRVKDSPDGAFHRCAMSANFTAQGHTLCLYVPPHGA